MTLQIDIAPLLRKGPVVITHALAAFAAIAAGSLQFALPKWTGLHRVLGYLWGGLLALVAGSSFFIFDLRLIGPFSPIHLVSAYTLWSLWTALQHARHGRIEAHRRQMVSLYTVALILTGLFTLIPGRTMHEVLAGG
ncbi:MAG: DUF2306 domain-containing protein [Pseudomonadota bacterium]